MLSMDSNVSGISRRTNVSLINMDSIISGDSSQKRVLPGEKGLKQAAERRMQKA